MPLRRNSKEVNMTTKTNCAPFSDAFVLASFGLGQWMEEYRKCGCTFVAQSKAALPGYCEKHGNDRLRVFPKLKEAIPLGLAK